MHHRLRLVPRRRLRRSTILDFAKIASQLWCSESTGGMTIRKPSFQLLQSPVGRLAITRALKKTRVTCFVPVGVNSVWCGCANGCVAVYNLAQCKLEHVFFAHSRTILDLIEFAGHVVTCSDDQTIKIWHPVTFKCVHYRTNIHAMMLLDSGPNQFWTPIVRSSDLLCWRVDSFGGLKSTRYRMSSSGWNASGGVTGTAKTSGIRVSTNSIRLSGSHFCETDSIVTVSGGSCVVNSCVDPLFKRLWILSERGMLEIVSLPSVTLSRNYVVSVARLQAFTSRQLIAPSGLFQSRKRSNSISRRRRSGSGFESSLLDGGDAAPGFYGQKTSMTLGLTRMFIGLTRRVKVWNLKTLQQVGSIEIAAPEPSIRIIHRPRRLRLVVVARTGAISSYDIMKQDIVVVGPTGSGSGGSGSGSGTSGSSSSSRRGKRRGSGKYSTSSRGTLTTTAGGGGGKSSSDRNRRRSAIYSGSSRLSGLFSTARKSPAGGFGGGGGSHVRVPNALRRAAGTPLKRPGLIRGSAGGGGGGHSHIRPPLLRSQSTRLGMSSYQRNRSSVLDPAALAKVRSRNRAAKISRRGLLSIPGDDVVIEGDRRSTPIATLQSQMMPISKSGDFAEMQQERERQERQEQAQHEYVLGKDEDEVLMKYLSWLFDCYHRERGDIEDSTHKLWTIYAIERRDERLETAAVVHELRLIQSMYADIITFMETLPPTDDLSWVEELAHQRREDAEEALRRYRQMQWERELVIHCHAWLTDLRAFREKKFDFSARCLKLIFGKDDDRQLFHRGRSMGTKRRTRGGGGGGGGVGRRNRSRSRSRGRRRSRGASTTRPRRRSRREYEETEEVERERLPKKETEGDDSVVVDDGFVCLTRQRFTAIEEAWAEFSARRLRGVRKVYTDQFSFLARSTKKALSRIAQAAKEREEALRLARQKMLEEIALLRAIIASRESLREEVSVISSVSMPDDFSEERIRDIAEARRRVLWERELLQYLIDSRAALIAERQRLDDLSQSALDALPLWDRSSVIRLAREGMVHELDLLRHILDSRSSLQFELSLSVCMPGDFSEERIRDVAEARRLVVWERELLRYLIASEAALRADIEDLNSFTDARLRLLLGINRLDPIHSARGTMVEEVDLLREILSSRQGLKDELANRRNRPNRADFASERLAAIAEARKQVMWERSLLRYLIDADLRLRAEVSRRNGQTDELVGSLGWDRGAVIRVAREGMVHEIDLLREIQCSRTGLRHALGQRREIVMPVDFSDERVRDVRDARQLVVWERALLQYLIDSEAALRAERQRKEEFTAGVLSSLFWDRSVLVRQARESMVADLALLRTIMDSKSTLSVRTSSPIEMPTDFSSQRIRDIAEARRQVLWERALLHYLIRSEARLRAEIASKNDSSIEALSRLRIAFDDRSRSCQAAREGFDSDLELVRSVSVEYDHRRRIFLFGSFDDSFGDFEVERRADMAEALLQWERNRLRALIEAERMLRADIESFDDGTLKKFLAAVEWRGLARMSSFQDTMDEIREKAFLSDLQSFLQDRLDLVRLRVKEDNDYLARFAALAEERRASIRIAFEIRMLREIRSLFPFSHREFEPDLGRCSRLEVERMSAFRKEFERWSEIWLVRYVRKFLPLVPNAQSLRSSDEAALRLRDSDSVMILERQAAAEKARDDREKRLVAHVSAHLPLFDQSLFERDKSMLEKIEGLAEERIMAMNGAYQNWWELQLCRYVTSRLPLFDLDSLDASDEARLDDEEEFYDQREAAVREACKNFLNPEKARKKREEAYASYDRPRAQPYVHFVNYSLWEDKDLYSVLPVCTLDDICELCRNGVVLNKLINVAIPDTIDERSINIVLDSSAEEWLIIENHQLMVNSLKGIGVTVKFVANDIRTGSRRHIRQVIWDLLLIYIFKNFNLQAHPELYDVVLAKKTTGESMLKAVDEWDDLDLLYTWALWRLSRHGFGTMNLEEDEGEGEEEEEEEEGEDGEESAVLETNVSTFSRWNITSCIEAFRLLSHCFFANDRCEIEESDDAFDRSSKVFACYSRHGLTRPFIDPIDLVDLNERGVTAFLGQMFLKFSVLSTEERRRIMARDADFFAHASEAREERLFRFWIKNVGFPLSRKKYHEEISKGLLILQIVDLLKPRLVNWDRVKRRPRSYWDKLSNCNYCIEVCKSLNLSTVGLGGVDLLEGKQKAILSIGFQLIQTHLINLLEKLGRGRRITKAGLVDWANGEVGRNSPHRIRSLADKSLASGVFLCHLCHAVSPRSINMELVTSGLSPRDRELNAKYAISTARKMGAVFFLLYDDILKVRSKNIMAFVASMLLIEKKKRGSVSIKGYNPARGFDARMAVLKKLYTNRTVAM